jgi:hypothetical protein
MKKDNRRLSEFFGETLTTSILIVKNLDDNVINEVKNVINYSFKSYKIEYRFTHIKGNLQLYWTPFDNFLYSYIKINHFFIIKDTQEFVEIPMKQVFKNYETDVDGICALENRNTHFMIELNNFSNLEGIRIEFESIDKSLPYNELINYKALYEKQKEYYNVLLNWIDIKNSEKSILSYLYKQELYNIAIYGYGELGQRLYSEIKNGANKACYIISAALSTNIYEIPIYTLDEFVNECRNYDIIIITPMFALNTILQNLLIKGIKTKSISIDYLMKQVLDES